MSCECESGKKKQRTADEYKSLTNRLSRIEGQVRGVRTMIENDAYCVDVLTQVAAINSALSAFSRELLANHIKTCVTEDIKNGREEAAEELIQTLGRLIK